MYTFLYFITDLRLKFNSFMAVILLSQRYVIALDNPGQKIAIPLSFLNVYKVYLRLVYILYQYLFWNRFHYQVKHSFHSSWQFVPIKILKWQFWVWCNRCLVLFILVGDANAVSLSPNASCLVRTLKELLWLWPLWNASLHMAWLVNHPSRMVPLISIVFMLSHFFIFKHSHYSWTQFCNYCMKITSILFLAYMVISIAFIIRWPGN